MGDDINIDQSIGAKPILHRSIPLEANNVLIIVSALLLGILISFQLSRQGCGFFLSFVPAGLLVGTAVAWALLLKQGKPPAYDVDFLSTTLLGKKSWEPDFKKLEQEHFTK